MAAPRRPRPRCLATPRDRRGGSAGPTPRGRGQGGGRAGAFGAGGRGAACGGKRGACGGRAGGQVGVRRGACGRGAGARRAGGMRLQCDVEVVSRLLPASGLRGRGRGTRALLLLGRPPGPHGACLVVCTARQRAGARYKVSPTPPPRDPRPAPPSGDPHRQAPPLAPPTGRPRPCASKPRPCSLSHVRGGRGSAAPGRAERVRVLRCDRPPRPLPFPQLKENIEQFFTRFVEEGKATVRLKEPAVDVRLSKVRGRGGVVFGAAGRGFPVLRSTCALVWARVGRPFF